MKNIKSIHCSSLTSILILGLSQSLSPAVAAEISSPAAQQDKVTALEPIIVEAQGPKKPTATTSQLIDHNDITVENIRDLRDLSGMSANVSSFDGGGNRMTQLSIRGVREQSYQSAPEIMPSVAYYIDDVPTLTTLGRVSLFNNIDHITLLKGPQVSGFGFSRPGGVIDIHTTQPSENPKGYATLGTGNYSALELSAGISTPLIKDTLHFSVDAIQAKRDGFYYNSTLDNSYGDKDAAGIRAKLSFKASETTHIDLNLLHEAFRDQADPYIFMPQTNPKPFSVAFDNPGYEDITQDMQALRIRSKIAGLDFLSVTAHRDSSWRYRSDAVQYGAYYDPYVGMTDEDVRSITQEFRISASPDNSIMSNWSAGLFLAHTKMDFAGGFLFDDFSVAFPLAKAQTTSKDLALFGDMTFPINNQLSLKAGLRYEWAGRKGDNEFAAPLITSGDTSYDEFLPSIALIFKPQDNLSLFAKYARGFKPGGFNARTSLTEPYDFEFGAETSNAYELGLSSSLNDNKINIEAALFYTDFSGYQDLTQINPSRGGVNNADKAESYGAELALSYQIQSNLRLFAQFGLTRAKFKEFNNGFIDFSNNRISFTPKYTATYGVAYGSDSGLYFNGKVRSTGSYFLDDGNAAEQESYHLIDLVAGYRWSQLDLSLYIDNLTDEQYVVSTSDNSGSGMGIGSLGDPAEYGLRLKVDF